MDSDRLNRWLTLGANLAVLVGIVFLAFELRQNNKALLTDAMLERQNLRREILSRRQDNPALVTATVKAQRGDPLSDEEAFVLAEEDLLRLVNWEITVAQVQQGLLSPDVIPIDGWRYEFHEGMPTMSESWESNKRFFPPEFIEFLDENVIQPGPL